MKGSQIKPTAHYAVLYEKDTKKVINDYKQQWRGEVVAHDEDRIGIYENNSLVQIEKYIKDNGLIIEDLNLGYELQDI